MVPSYHIVIISTIWILHFPTYNEPIKYSVVVLMIDYSPLWKTMEQKGISQYHLLQNGVDNKTLDSLKKSKNITMLTLEKLCRIIGCTPNDIVRFIEK